MKAYELALDHIEEGILSGRYEVGSILPPERELATQLGIGRSSVREAIRALESQGVLDSAVGAGPASGTRVTSDQSRALTRLLKLHVSLGKYPVDDVVEARVSLERGSAALASTHATADALARLAEVVEAMEAAESIAEFSPLDTCFHVLIAEVSENTLISDLTRAVREALLQPIARASARMADWPGLPRRAQRAAPPDLRRDPGRRPRRGRRPDGAPHPARVLDPADERGDALMPYPRPWG